MEGFSKLFSDSSDEDNNPDPDHAVVTSTPSTSEPLSLSTSYELTESLPLTSEYQQSPTLTNCEPKTSLPEGFIVRGSYCLNGESKERLRGIFRENKDILDIVYLDGEVLYTATSIYSNNGASDVSECESSDHDSITKSSEIHFKLGDEHYEFKIRENTADLMRNDKGLVALHNVSDSAFCKVTPLDLRNKLFLFNFSKSEMVVKHPDMESSLPLHSSGGESEGEGEDTEKVKEGNLISGFSGVEKSFYERLKERQMKSEFYFFDDMAYIAHKLQLLQKTNVMLPRKYYYQAIYFRLESVLLNRMIFLDNTSLENWVEVVKSKKELTRFLNLAVLKKSISLLEANPMKVTSGTEFKFMDLLHSCISIDFARVSGRKFYINVIIRTVKWIMNEEVTEQDENSFAMSLRHFHKKRNDFLSDEKTLVYPASILKNLRYPHDFDWTGEIPEGFIELDQNQKRFLVLGFSSDSNVSEHFEYFKDVLEKGRKRVAIKKDYVQPQVYDYYAFDYCLLGSLFGRDWFTVLSQEEGKTVKTMKKMAKELLKEDMKTHYTKVLDLVSRHLDPDVNCHKTMRDSLFNFKSHF